MPANSLRLGTVKRDEKEAKLSEFVSRTLATAGIAGTCLLIARSAESPVAKTVLSLGANASLKGFAVRAIFANLGTAETARIAEACRISDWALQVRWARDARLLDAHEQLVLGPAACWIGDCMRREPLTRDGCELFSPESPAAAEKAALFFERLWQVCEPVFERRLSVEQCQPEAAIASLVEQIAPEGADKPASSRTPA